MSAQNEIEFVGTVATGIVDVRLIYLDHGLPKISVQDGEGFELYNTKHTLFQSINFPDEDSLNGLANGARFITKSLFDCDSTNAEYQWTAWINEFQIVRVYRDDGTILFELEGYTYYGRFPTSTNEASVVSSPTGSYHLLNSFCQPNSQPETA
jgi:hypothetical protein